jgi:P22_AR N-terminal domain
MSALIKVDFYGDTLFAQQEVDGEVIVAVKPIIERLGLDWSSQLKRIRRDDVLTEGMVIMTIPSPGGPQQAVSLPLNLIPGFLLGIETTRIPNPETRAVVITYQRECHAVLFRHFFGTRADPAESFDWEVIGAKVQLVREARLTGGKKAAAGLWRLLGLPELEGVANAATPRQGALHGVDFVRQFLGECTVEAPGCRVQARVLASRYREWAMASKAPDMTERAFAMCLDALEVPKQRGQVHYYLGFRIRHASESAE